MIARSKILAALCWSGVGLAGAAFAAFSVAADQDRRQHAIRPDDGCLAYVSPPAVTLVLNDRTDPLEGDQPRRWRAALDSEISRLPSGSVLLIGSIGPAAPTEMNLEKLCVPLVGRGARATELQERFNRRLDAMASELERSPSTSHSAISATIAAASADVAFLKKTTGARRIEVSSDLLENDVASAYRPGNFTLPPLSSQALQGVTVHFNVFRNQRDQGLQTHRLIEKWTQWAKNGGATSVEVDAPWLGYRAPAPSSGNATP